MASNRNRFSRGTGALKTVQLSDPFSTMIANLNKNLTYLNQQKALAALAAGDPDTFLRLSPNISKDLKGQELDDWNHLIQKAQDKIEETAWAQMVNEDPSKLEDFAAHLRSKLDSTDPGTKEYYDLLQGLDLATKGIKARNENAADQKALSEYIDSGDHEAYASYLTLKLQSTTDPTVFNSLATKIQTLKERIATEAQVGRVRARAEAMSAYLDGGSAAKAIQRLQELANDPKITATEVAALQTLVTQIHDREDSKARAGASSAGATLGADIPALNKNIQQYNKDANELDALLKGGSVPNPLDPNDRITKLQLALDADTQVLMGQYSSMAEVAGRLGERGTVISLNGTMDTLDSFYKSIPERVDKNIYDKAVGKTSVDFAESMKTMTAEQQAQARIRRTTDLAGIMPVLTTEGKKGQVAQEVRDMATDNRDALAKLSTENGLSNGQQQKLDLLYQEYSTSEHVSSPVGETQFIQAVRDAMASDDPAHVFAKATGYKIPTTDLFGMVVNEKGEAVNELKKFIEDASELSTLSQKPENQQRAMDLYRTLLSTPGGIPFGPPGSPEYQITGLTSQDVNEMRRGLGLIAGGYNPAGMVDPMGSGGMQLSPQINAPITGGIGFGQTKGPGQNALTSEQQMDLTGSMSSEQEIRQEQMLMRQQQREMQRQQQMTIDDTLLMTTPPPPPPMMLDSIMADMMAPQQPMPDYSGLDPRWAEALKFLDDGVNIDVPGFEIPHLPDPTPFDSNRFDIGLGVSDFVAPSLPAISHGAQERADMAVPSYEGPPMPDSRRPGRPY